MKQFFIILLSLSTFTVKATILTVSNNPTTIAQFNTIQAAINAANSGDTIYVHGSPFTYAGFTITDKRLAIIGPGWAPDKNLPYTANVDGCTITGAASTGSEIQGLNIPNNGIQIGTNHPDSLRFIRNRFSTSMTLNQSSTTYKGYVFEGNQFIVFGSVNGTSASIYDGFVFRNNYFFNNFGSGQLSGFTNATNFLVDHNLWFGGTQDCFSFNCSGLLITNNIFVSRNPSANLNLSTFNNNITFNTLSNSPWSVNGNIDAGGNISNQDPQMADQAAVNAATNNPLLNFTIAAGPANNSGSDGKDMGFLYDASGSLNFANSRGSRLPFVFSLNITNPTIAAGGTLSIQVEARKSN